MAAIEVYVELMRPFTLLAPLIGFISGGVIARGATQASWSLRMLLLMLIGALAAALLNAASNIINQIYDLQIDRVNKPTRPLPSGRIDLSATWKFTYLLYALSFLLALCVNLNFFGIVLFTAFVTYAYSGPPFRTKRWGVLANFTIALPRGCLLMVAGWSAVASPWQWEPWTVGLVFGLFVLGAATTKDYADMRGDALYGCRTLPIMYGVRASAWITAPFFVVPFLFMLWAALKGWLTGNLVWISALAALLSAWGVYIDWLILRKPEALATEANHVSWKHMYLMLIAAQVGLALAYLI